MPTLDYPWNPVLGPAVMPISGNTNYGSACLDPSGSSKGLYAVFHEGAFRMFRTVGGYRDLVTLSDSVESLSSIFAPPLAPVVRPAVTLSVIGDSIFAAIAATVAGRVSYVRLYRDLAGDGSGPWVRHGNLPGDGVDFDVKYDYTANAWPTTSEIMTQGDKWAIAHLSYRRGSLGSDSYVMADCCVSESSDGGATWAVRTSWTSSLTSFAYSVSRNSSAIQGDWYIGAWGNPTGRHWKSSNLTNWANLGQLNMVNFGGDALSVVATDPTHVYALSSWGNTYGGAHLLRAIHAPETLPTWEFVGDLTGMANSLGINPHLADIGSEVRPLWLASGRGRIRALSPIEPPVTRLYPRTDGRGLSSAPRHVGGVPRSRIVGGHP